MAAAGFGARQWSDKTSGLAVGGLKESWTTEYRLPGTKCNSGNPRRRGRVARVLWGIRHPRGDL